MKCRIAVGSLFLLLSPILLTEAMSAVEVVGSSNAHECFLAAKSGVEIESGLAHCDAALQQSEMSIHDRAGTLVNRGVLKSDKKLTEEAMADYNASIELYPSLGDAYVDRAAALIVLRRYDEALIDTNKSLQVESSYPYLGYYNRAVAEELMGKYQEAYMDFKHVLELEPTFSPASEQLKNFVVTTKPASK